MQGVSRGVHRERVGGLHSRDGQGLGCFGTEAKTWMRGAEGLRGTEELRGAEGGGRGKDERRWTQPESVEAASSKRETTASDGFLRPDF